MFPLDMHASEKGVNVKVEEIIGARALRPPRRSFTESTDHSRVQSARATWRPTSDRFCVPSMSRV